MIMWSVNDLPHQEYN